MHRLNLISSAVVAIVTIFNLSAASAADLSAKAPSYVTSPVYNWTGLYVGGHVGYASVSETQTGTDLSTVPLEFGSNKFNGGLGGGQIGFRYQIGTVVLGVEGDYSWAGLDGPSCGNLAFRISTYTCKSRIDSIASVTGQFGIAYDRALFYLKAGEAWARERDTLTQFTSDPLNLISTSVSGLVTRNGPTVGAGLEWAFSSNWSARAEYDYIHLDTTSIPLTSPLIPGRVFHNDVLDQIHLVKLGINYKFDVLNSMAAGH